MKRTTLVAAVAVIALSLMTARGHAQSVDVDEDGCWVPTYDCVSTSSDWEGDTFYSYYRSNCPARIYITYCNETTAYRDRADCGTDWLDPGKRKAWATFEGATARYAYAYVGSTITRKDWTCSGKFGLSDWSPSW